MQTLLTNGLSSQSQRTLITAGLGVLTAAAIAVELKFCLLSLGLTPAPRLILDLLAEPIAELALLIPAIQMNAIASPCVDVALVPLPALALAVEAAPEAAIALNPAPALTLALDACKHG